MPLNYAANNVTASAYYGISSMPFISDTLIFAAGLVLIITLALLVTQELERYKRFKSLIEYTFSFAINVVFGGLLLITSWCTYEALKVTASNVHLTLQQTLEIIAGIILAGVVGGGQGIL